MSYRQCILLFLTSFSLFASSIKETELAVSEWLAIEKEKCQAERNWEQERLILESEAILLKNQLAQTNKLIDAALKNKGQSKAKVGTTKLTHQTQLTNLIDLTSLYNQQVNLFKQELSNFPTPFQTPFLAKLAIQQEASLTLKFSQFLGLMSDAQKLTKQWHLIDQKLKMGNHEILCKVLYAGVSKGFAMTRDKSQAFVGTYRRGQWIWVKSTEIKAITMAIKNYENGGISQCQLPFFGVEHE